MTPHVLCLVIAVAALSGCASVRHFKVVAYKSHGTDSPNDGATYHLVQSAPDSARVTNGLELVPIMDRMLADRGFAPAPRGSKPQLIIEVKAGIGEPRQDTHVVPDSGWSRHLGEVYTAHLVEHPELATARVPMRLESVAVYRKHLHVTAYTPEEPRTQLWSVTVLNEDASDDLAACLPLMAEAAGRFLATDTAELRIVQVAENARRRYASN